MRRFGENTIFSMFICDVTAELMNINEIGSKFPNAISSKPVVKKIEAVFTIHLLATNAFKILLSKDVHKRPLTYKDRNVSVFLTFPKMSKTFQYQGIRWKLPMICGYMIKIKCKVDHRYMSPHHNKAEKRSHAHL